MQKITTHLWYDKAAREAAEFYTAAFGNGSKVTSVANLDGTPSGSVDVVTFELFGRGFQAISAGPYFQFNPSISMQVTCPARDDVDALWKKFSDGGTVLMDLGSYPFSDRYGWVQDKFGLSWQFMYSTGENVNQKITPVIMFVGGVCGKAEEAIHYWISVFQDGKLGALMHYGKSEAPDNEGSLKYGSFSLFGQEYRAMDSGYPHAFGFNESISFIVTCNTQAEIDHYWNSLSSVPEAEQCGWLKDRFGVSWQIVPSVLGEMMSEGSKDQIERATKAFLQMKKFDIAALVQAYEAGS